MIREDRIVNHRAAVQALRDFINTVNATGGIYRYESGELSGCAADPEWLDLAGAYETACEALGEEVISSLNPHVGSSCNEATHEPNRS